MAEPFSRFHWIAIISMSLSKVSAASRCWSQASDGSCNEHYNTRDLHVDSQTKAIRACKQGCASDRRCAAMYVSNEIRWPGRHHCGYCPYGYSLHGTQPGQFDRYDRCTSTTTTTTTQVGCTAQSYAKCQGNVPCIDLRQGSTHHHLMWLNADGTAHVDGQANNNNGLGIALHRVWTCTCTQSCSGLVGVWNCPRFYTPLHRSIVTITTDYADNYTSLITDDFIDVCSLAYQFNDCTTGPDCTGSAAGKGFCVTVRIWKNGQRIAATPSDNIGYTLQSCQDLCSTVPNCKFVTFQDQYGGQCHMYEACPSWRSRVQTRTFRKVQITTLTTTSTVTNVTNTTSSTTSTTTSTASTTKITAIRPFTTTIAVNTTLEGVLIIQVTNTTQFLHEANVAAVMTHAVAEILNVSVTWIPYVKVSRAWNRRVNAQGFQFTTQNDVRIEFRCDIPPDGGPHQWTAVVLMKQFDELDMDKITSIVDRVLKSGALSMPYNGVMRFKFIKLRDEQNVPSAPAAKQVLSRRVIMLIIFLSVVIGMIACIIPVKCYLRTLSKKRLRTSETCGEHPSELMHPPAAIDVDSKDFVRKVLSEILADSNANTVQVFISFASGRRTQDVVHSGPGMFYAAAVMKALLQNEQIHCYTSLPDITDKDICAEVLSGRFSCCKILIILETRALYEDRGCLEDIYAAYTANMDILRLRCEESIPDDVWSLLDPSDSHSLWMAKSVQQHLATDLHSWPPAPLTIQSKPSLLENFTLDVKCRLQLLQVHGNSNYSSPQSNLIGQPTESAVARNAARSRRSTHSASMSARLVQRLAGKIVRSGGGEDFVSVPQDGPYMELDEFTEAATVVSVDNAQSDAKPDKMKKTFKPATARIADRHFPRSGDRGADGLCPTSKDTPARKVKDTSRSTVAPIALADTSPAAKARLPRRGREDLHDFSPAQSHAKSNRRKPKAASAVPSTSTNRSRAEDTGRHAFSSEDSPPNKTSRSEAASEDSPPNKSSRPDVKSSKKAPKAVSTLPNTGTSRSQRSVKTSSDEHTPTREDTRLSPFFPDGSPSSKPSKSDAKSKKTKKLLQPASVPFANADSINSASGRPPRSGLSPTKLAPDFSPSNACARSDARSTTKPPRAPSEPFGIAGTAPAREHRNAGDHTSRSCRKGHRPKSDFVCS